MWNERDFLLGTFADAPTVAIWAGTRHLMSNQAVKELAYDGRLLQIAQAALGVPGVPFRATLFAKSGAANWLAYTLAPGYGLAPRDPVH